MTNAGMTEYTKWWIKYPWHVTKDMFVPNDCGCEYCEEKRTKASNKGGRQ